MKDDDDVNRWNHCATKIEAILQCQDIEGHTPLGLLPDVTAVSESVQQDIHTIQSAFQGAVQRLTNWREHVVHERNESVVSCPFGCGAVVQAEEIDNHKKHCSDRYENHLETYGLK